MWKMKMAYLAIMLVEYYLILVLIIASSFFNIAVLSMALHLISLAASGTTLYLPYVVGSFISQVHRLMRLPICGLSVLCWFKPSLS